MTNRKRTIKGLTDVAKNISNQVVDTARKPVRKAKDAATDVHRKYEESGAKGKVDTVQSQISGKFDEVSGQAMYHLVQERLAEQDRFNDLMATKLHEALKRISDLERRLGAE